MVDLCAGLLHLWENLNSRRTTSDNSHRLSSIIPTIRSTALILKYHSVSHCAECSSFPLKSPNPAISGHFQLFKTPEALNRTSQSSLLISPSLSTFTFHFPPSSSQTASQIRLLYVMYFSTLYLVATLCTYFKISGPPEKKLLHWVLCSNVYW